MTCYSVLISRPWLAISGFIMLWSLLTGCSYKTANTVNNSQRELLWQQHYQQVSALSNWRLTGRLGIVSETDSGAATLYWEQHPETFSMKIVAPLGRGIVNIRGEGSRISMQDANGEISGAGSADELIWQRTGWLIPVKDLQKWALGLPDHRLAFEYTLDEEGHLETLTTAGWNIRYQRYIRHLGVSLPQKIHMQNNKLRLKLIVTRWDLL